MIPMVTPTTVAISNSSVVILGSILVLLILLVSRELTQNMVDVRAQRLRLALDISLVPLLIIFSTVVVVALIQALD